MHVVALTKKKLFVVVEKELHRTYPRPVGPWIHI